MRVISFHLLSCFSLALHIELICCLFTSKAAVESNGTASSTKPSATAQITSQGSSARFESNSSQLWTSGLKAANDCWSQWDAYSLHSTQCQQTTTSVMSNTLTEVETSIAYETFELCDGHPRARVAGGEITSTVTISELLSASLVSISGSTFFSAEGTRFSYMTTVLPASGIPLSTATSTVTTVVKVPQTRCIVTKPTPQCSIDSNNCRSLFAVWSAGDFKRNKPPCHYDPPKDPCVQCNIFIPSVKLMYFPVSMTGNFCGDYSTVTPTSIGNDGNPTTVKISGTTFTSGFAYFSYAGITPGNGGGICGSKRSAGILAVPSSEVSSYRGHVPAMQQAGDIKWSFNFADLAPNPVPWDAWIGQQTCAEHTQSPNCQIITQAAYRPALAYPRQLWSLDPAWSNCHHFAFGIVDPPTALVVAGTAAGPTYGGLPPITSSPPLPQPGASHELSTVTSTQSSQDAGNDGSARTSTSTQLGSNTTRDTVTSTIVHTSERTVIITEPVPGTFLPNITTMDHTGDGSAVPPSNAPSETASVPPTSSGSAVRAPSGVYLNILLLVILLAGMLVT